jgi:diaminobutyrate-2-oxoglutarate transaminase
MKNDTIESDVRSYCRVYDDTFRTATGATIVSESGRSYIDFLSGCGSLNYGHNNQILKGHLVDYILGDGIAHGLDLRTTAKNRFLDVLQRYVLEPRNLTFKVQFTGPTGANAVEAAIKLARKATGRTNVIAFTNAFHGCSMGALSLTANEHHRSSSRAMLNQVTRWPYDGYFGPDCDTAKMLDQALSDPSSGIDPPAAIILEVVQGEGGLNCASHAWLGKLRAIADKHSAALIFDEIQAGCGRTGSFFSFEPSGVVPDMVVLAKSISGFGLPMALVLIRPDLDTWEPGEHNGTFRGNNHAFVTAAAAIETYWQDDAFTRSVGQTSELLAALAHDLAKRFEGVPKGKGMFMGLELESFQIASETRRRCFESGLIIELCGPRDTILKFMPSLTITENELRQAHKILIGTLAASYSDRER